MKSIKSNVMIAYCGLVCDECPIHLATLETDLIRQQAMREDIVRQCAITYGIDIQLADVTDCDGCRAESGRLFSGCRKCAIRNCAMEREVEGCARCSDYPCEKLDDIFRQEPDAKARLDAIHQTFT
jgi:hypothetical protein